MSQEPSPADEPSTAKIDLRSKPQRSSQWRPFSIEPSTAKIDLRSKPQRGSQWHPFSMLLLFGGILVIGAGTLLAWQFAAPYGKATPDQSKSTAPTHSPITCNLSPSVLGDELRQGIAAQLHLTVAEVTAQIQAGKSLPDVAATQNVSPDQLVGLEHNVLKITYGPLLEDNCISVADIQNSKYYNDSDADLNHDFTLLFS